jgi:hypothetical protein
MQGGTSPRKSLVGLRKPCWGGLHAVRWKQARSGDRRPTKILACLSPPYIVSLSGQHRAELVCFSFIVGRRAILPTPAAPTAGANDLFSWENGVSCRSFSCPHTPVLQIHPNWRSFCPRNPPRRHRPIRFRDAPRNPVIYFTSDTRFRRNSLPSSRSQDVGAVRTVRHTRRGQFPVDGYVTGSLPCR